jgi:hypothetical protein
MTVLNSPVQNSGTICDAPNLHSQLLQLPSHWLTTAFSSLGIVPKRKTFKIPGHLSQDQFSTISIQEHEQYGDLKELVNKRAWAL